MMKSLLALLLALPMVICAADLESIAWGVISAKSTTVRNKTGESIGQAYGGDLFEVLREISVNQEPALYVQPDKKNAKPCIILAADCQVIEEVPPSKEDKEAYADYRLKKKVLSDYYGILLSRNGVLERAKEKHLKDSPAKELPKLLRELAEVPAKERAYEQRQKNAKTDTERLKYQNLRKELRYQATGLQTEIARLKPLAEKWDAEHPFDASGIEKSGVYIRLTKQLDALQERLAGMGITVTH